MGKKMYMLKGVTNTNHNASYLLSVMCNDMNLLPGVFSMEAMFNLVRTGIAVDLVFTPP